MSGMSEWVPPPTWDGPHTGYASPAGGEAEDQCAQNRSGRAGGQVSLCSLLRIGSVLTVSRVYMQSSTGGRDPFRAARPYQMALDLGVRAKVA